MDGKESTYQNVCACVRSMHLFVCIYNCTVDIYMVYHQNESCNDVEGFPDKCSMCVLELLDPLQNRKANAGDNIKVSVRVLR